jgi:hypothetical protein
MPPLLPTHVAAVRRRVALQPPLSSPALSRSGRRDSGEPSSTEIVVIRRDRANLLPYASAGAGASKWPSFALDPVASIASKHIGCSYHH